MKNISTGAGLAIVGLGIALHPVLSHVLAAAPNANAAQPGSLVPSAAVAKAEPTVVWMGVQSSTNTIYSVYSRMWSDGRLETRFVARMYTFSSGICYRSDHCSTDWVEVPPPPGGDGIACRSDVNGDRIVNGADLSVMLNAWGQEGGCEPEATYPCLDLGSLTNAAAMK